MSKGTYPAAEPAPSGAGLSGAALRSLARGPARLAFRVALVVWAAATLAFLVLQLTPGSFVDILIDSRGQFDVSDARKAEVVAFYGFDRPLWQQYLIYLSSVARGDLGVSFAQSQPVLSLIAAQALPTLSLALASIATALVLAVVVSVASLRLGQAGRFLVSLVEILALSAPSFWLGSLLITWLSFRLGWFPATGAKGWASIVLPALTLGIPMAGTFIQVLRPELAKACRAPHFLTARARGRSWLGALRRHALPHAMMPLLTLAASYFAYLLSGAVIVENLFGRPGLGRILLNAVIAKDVPLVAGLAILSAAGFVLVNAATDALLRRLDPRLKA